jgi:hypothetical protein
MKHLSSLFLAEVDDNSRSNSNRKERHNSRLGLECCDEPNDAVLTGSISRFGLIARMRTLIHAIYGLNTARTIFLLNPTLLTERVVVLTISPKSSLFRAADTHKRLGSSVKSENVCVGHLVS